MTTENERSCRHWRGNPECGKITGRTYTVFPDPDSTSEAV